MNSIKEYKSVIVLALAILLLLGGVLFSHYSKKHYEEAVVESKKELNIINEVLYLQNLWGGKGVYKKLKKLIKDFPDSGRRMVKLERRKFTLSLDNLSDRELNRIVSKIASLPVQFIQLDILRSGQRYRLECLCKW